MSYQSLNYFFQKNWVDESNIVGYFDFSDPSKSGSSVWSGDSFNKEKNLSLIIEDGAAWGNGGRLIFNGQNSFPISGSSINSYFYVAAIDNCNLNNENVIFSSYRENGISGFKFAINKYRYPYIEYYDNILGRVFFNSSKKVNPGGRGVYCFGQNSIGNFFIGSYSYTNNAVEEECPNWIPDFTPSNERFLGGVRSGVDNFSGIINELVIYENGALQSIDKNLIISGMAYDINEAITTGTISGQTGTLYGDVIVLNSCHWVASGSTGVLSGQYTGLNYFLPTYNEFIDFNNESFSEYLYSGISGTHFSTFVNMVTDNYRVCSQSVTGYDFYEYSSGYSIDYIISTLSIYLKKPEFLHDIRSGIKVNFDFQSGDCVSIFYQKSSGTFIDNTNIKITHFDFGIESYINNNADELSSLYYNGQYQRLSTGYSKSMRGGSLVYNPSEDFIGKNNTIYSNGNTYRPIDYSIDRVEYNLLGDLQLNTGILYIFETGFASGINLIDANFEGSLVFFNGQLLDSGVDYNLPNKILFSGDSGLNVISINKLNIPLQFERKYINENHHQNELTFQDNFISNTSMIWLNGVRLFNEVDYQEI